MADTRQPTARRKRITLTTSPEPQRVGDLFIIDAVAEVSLGSDLQEGEQVQFYLDAEPAARSLEETDDNGRAMYSYEIPADRRVVRLYAKIARETTRSPIKEIRLATTQSFRIPDKMHVDPQEVNGVPHIRVQVLDQGRNPCPGLPVSVNDLGQMPRQQFDQVQTNQLGVALFEVRRFSESRRQFRVIIDGSDDLNKTIDVLGTPRYTAPPEPPLRIEGERSKRPLNNFMIGWRAGKQAYQKQLGIPDQSTPPPPSPLVAGNRPKGMVSRFLAWWHARKNSDSDSSEGS
ncbi:MAG: hypothetical protein Q8Q94_01585 [bacterium]|nr:hypothetical protein [bacterium]MDZ4299698.1 hypothetical protein [Candidatus Sungbacteria bacterium]